MLDNNLPSHPHSPGLSIKPPHLLLEGKLCIFEDSGIDLLKAVLESSDGELPVGVEEDYEGVTPGAPETHRPLVVDELLAPSDLVDVNHFESGDENGGDGDNVLRVVAPHSVDEALLHKVVDVLSILDEEQHQLELERAG